MKGLLVRVGIDQTCGGWNAPFDPRSGRFVYVPIPESPGVAFHPGCARCYTEIREPLAAFVRDAGEIAAPPNLPATLGTADMHLDPDFAHLTYGDQGMKARRLCGLGAGDLLVFYAGLRSARAAAGRLTYALIGLYVVEEVVSAAQVPSEQRHENAHTRRVALAATDVVVRGRPAVSGRLERCIPIGEWRERAYRVRRDLLEAWGGLSVRDGYLQRSGRPPNLLNPPRFLAWFCQQSVPLVPRNN